MRPTLAHLAVLFLPPVPALAQHEYPVAQGVHADVVCWFPAVRFGDALAEEVSVVVEHVCREAPALYGLEAPAALVPDERETGDERPVRLVVHAFENRRGEDGFLEAVLGVEPGASVGAPSWVHWPSRGIYLKLQPVVRDALQEELGFPPRTLRLAAEETARLLALDATGGEPRAPRWFSRGSSTWLGDRAMVAAGRALPGTQCPAVSTRVRIVRELVTQGRLPAMEDVLAGATPGLTDREAIALEALLFDLVAERLGDEALHELGALLVRGVPDEVATGALLAALGIEGAGELEAEFLGRAQQLEAPWHDAFPGLHNHPEGYVQTASTDPYALAWNVAPEWEEYVIRAEVYLFRNRDGMGQVNFALGRLPSGEYVSIAFNSRNGIMAWNYQPDRQPEPFAVITEKPLGTPVQARNWYKLTLRVADGLVTPFVRDLEEDTGVSMLRPLSVEGRDMSGTWGIGTVRGCGALWRNVEIAPYVPGSGGGGDDEDDGDDGDGDR